MQVCELNGVFRGRDQRLSTSLMCGILKIDNITMRVAMMIKKLALSGDRYTVLPE